MSVHRRFTAFAGAAAATAALGLAAFAAAGPAAAAAADDIFIDVISEQGIGFTSPEAAVDAGIVVCQLVDDGAAPLEAAQIVHAESGLSSDDAAFFVGASIATFCPEYGVLIGA